ncbi:MAG: hypothetical protein J0H00_13300 [Burkholderiales bacterium]|nr:hypothetical protein [Burkholderiales bacterium]OJX02166.1 MAG: hypothetical protein BGO72_14410 [Burkholderiales bacterium 70-64]
MTHLAKTIVTLTRPHTHAGKAYGVGDRVEIDATSADWLIAHDIATPEPTAPIADRITEPEPKPLQRKEPKQ